MNFINPIPNAEFQIGIVCALMCIMFIFLYVGVKLINRIEELRADMIEMNNALDKDVAILRQYTHSRNAMISNSIEQIENQLNRPLYEVGNTIWFNDGANGKPGVFEDIKGKILEVKGDGKSEPYYLVKHTLGEELIIQSLIIAWTN